jgi:sulfate/thiosulfate transport system permease protein
VSVAAPAPSRTGGRGKLVRGTLLTLALFYVGVLLIAPLTAIILATFSKGWDVISSTFSAPDVRHAYWLTAIITVITIVVTAFFGLVTAMVLARDKFPGKRIVNAFVDLPMAVSPVIVGLMAVLLFGRGGWFEPFFAAQGIQIIFALPSMILVTIFICIPFVIREVAPVLEEIGVEEEEAAQTLGAGWLQTFFRVTLPSVRWALYYGIALSAARALGEIGAVLIVSGSLQGLTETATLYIFRALEERQDASGYVVALSLAAISIILLITIEVAKRRQDREMGKT